MIVFLFIFGFFFFSMAVKQGQINHLYRCFLNLGKESYRFPPNHLKKRYFLSLPNLHNNPLLSVILTSMFETKKHLKFVDFAKYLSNFEVIPPQMKPEQKQAWKEKKLKSGCDYYFI